MIARLTLYIILALLVLSPSLAVTFGMPRLDTLLSYMLPGIFIVLLMLVRMNKATAGLIFTQLALLLFGLASTLSNAGFANLPDIMFLPIASVFLLLFVWGLSPMQDPINGARALLTWATVLVVIPVYIEVATGFRFTPLALNGGAMEGVFKGTFFNPNDMSSVLAALLVAQIYFYRFLPTPRRKRTEGMILFGISIGAVLIGGSRTALLIAVLVFFLSVLIRASRNQRIPLGMLAVASLALLSDLTWLEPILLWAMEVEVLSYSAEKLHLALFFLQDDNSISYRTEIISYFFDNFRFLFTGFGPRNYGEYFRGLSNSLAATNPHVYLIEMYLAFGMFGFLATVAFFGQVFFLALRPESSTTALRSRQKLFAALAVIVFLILSFVPSSIMRLGIIWFPLTLILWHQIYAQSLQRRRNRDRALITAQPDASVEVPVR